MDNNEIVYINLDRPRMLRLTNRVLKRFTAKYKISLTDFESVLQRYDVLVGLLYEMLHAEDPSLTEDQCDDLLDAVPVTEIINACTEAIIAGQATGEKKTDDPTKSQSHMIG